MNYKTLDKDAWDKLAPAEQWEAFRDLWLRSFLTPDQHIELKPPVISPSLHNFIIKTNGLDQPLHEIRLENVEDEPPTELYSYNGLCPNCGVELERTSIGVTDGVEELTDTCPSCGWSDISYDG